MTKLSALTELVDQITLSLPEGVFLAVAPAEDRTDDLFPIEAAAMRRARAPRREEFAAGRRAARLAMRAAGFEPQAVPVQEDRSPVWPRGLTGSISHTDALAIAVVSTREDTWLGIDIEADADLPADLMDEICTKAERFLAAEEPLAARRAFSAKEAAYKAQYPQTRTIFGFDRLHLRPGRKALADAVFTANVPPFQRGSALHVQQWADHGFVVSLCLAPVLEFAKVQIGR